ncbi:MAG: hypothetical protein K0A95_09680 [Chromatiales bacterium]|nr:hypothetical protein [Gammaproteobacteria bacterium]MBW6477329.1 hypothetical protein [Chromatiales bacterium]
MRYWRYLLLCVLIAWLPLQVVAGQFAPCPHEHKTSFDSDNHHAHHAHHHAELHDHQMRWQQSYCPDCDVSASKVDNTAKTPFHCDHCQCCHVAISPGILTSTLANTLIVSDHWHDTLIFRSYSRHIQPGLRPPLSLA